MAERTDPLMPEERRLGATSDPQAESMRVNEQRYAAARTSDDPEEIRAGIEQTRADMSETIEALQERLSPTNIRTQAQEQVRESFEEAKHMVREATIGRIEHMVDRASDTANEARWTIGETIRQNPIPAALVGIGLGWMFMNGSSSRGTPVRYSGRGSLRGAVRGGEPYYTGQQAYAGRARYAGDPYYAGRPSTEGGQFGEQYRRAADTAGDYTSRATHTASEYAEGARQTVGEYAESTRETVGEYAESARQTAGEWADEARYQAGRMEDRFPETLQDNPLMVGAVALALGAAVGLAIPQTERENELMGETRDNLVERAQETAQDTMQRVQRVAESVAEDTTQNVKEQAREQGLTSS